MILTTEFLEARHKKQSTSTSIYVYVLMGKKGEKLWPSVRLCLHTCKLAMVWYHQNRRDVMK